MFLINCHLNCNTWWIAGQDIKLPEHILFYIRIYNKVINNIYSQNVLTSACMLSSYTDLTSASYDTLMYHIHRTEQLLCCQSKCSLVRLFPYKKAKHLLGLAMKMRAVNLFIRHCLLFVRCTPPHPPEFYQTASHVPLVSFFEPAFTIQVQRIRYCQSMLS